MKKSLSIDSLSYNDLPKPYNAEHEIHRACRDGSTDEVIKILKSHPDLINVPDGKVKYPIAICIVGMDTSV